VRHYNKDIAIDVSDLQNGNGADTRNNCLQSATLIDRHDGNNPLILSRS